MRGTLPFMAGIACEISYGYLKMWGELCQMQI